MKVNFLIAALAATMVSALPANNTAVATATLTKRSCSSITLRWTVGPRSSDPDDYTFDNTFTFEITYPNSQGGYAKSFSFRQRWDDRPFEKRCHPDGVWCVSSKGWNSSEAVWIRYANKDSYYHHPSKKFPEDRKKHERFTYEYWNCL
ncbi:hypothetical protein BGW39_004442 [Mortierella sp. 14UC]|nr:hypothetical protein BGW39_004442 [Mortierella sp. 14UC]